MDPFGTLEQILAKCLAAMFEGKGRTVSCSLTEPPLPLEAEVILASVGFGCEGAGGSLLLLAPRETVQAIEPAAVGGAGLDAECDAVGELANMLVGRLKNQLLHRDVVLLLGTPLTTIARAARVLATHGSTSSAWFGVDFPTGRLLVRLDARFEPPFEVGVERPVSVHSAGAEGDMLFF
jgi:hypothetical protein